MGVQVDPPGLFNNLLSISAFHYDRVSVELTDTVTAVLLGEKSTTGRTS